MIRWLLIALFIFIIIRILQGPKKRKRPSIRFHFGNMNNRNGHFGNRRQKLDEIEEAEFEDITEKVKKGKDS
jgi:hypothetical protein